MHKRYFLILLSLFLISGPVAAQEKFKLADDIDHSWRAGIDLGKSIIQPSNKDLKVFLFGSAAVIFSMLLADEAVKDYALENTSVFKDNLFKIDRYYGNYRYMGGGILLMYGSGYLLKDKHLKNMGLRTGQALIYNGFIGVVLKEISGRSRPFTNEGSFSYHPFAFQEQYRAFYSGHTSSAFAFSTVMAYEFDCWWWKTIWYGAAILVGGARIYHNQHWFSDAVAGALVGYAVGRFVANYDYPETESVSTGMYMDNQRQSMVFSLSIPLNL
ncbi:MAG: phosphatase PAP2 family protein [Calditrichaceae bacterium]|nr:phosphatase PAP2 family protein [Calditrichaceae bacterium]